MIASVASATPRVPTPAYGTGDASARGRRSQPRTFRSTESSACRALAPRSLHDVGSEARGLPFEGVANLWTGQHVRERLLERGALRDLLGELGRQPTVDRVDEHPLQRRVLEHLAHQPLHLIEIDRRRRCRRLRRPRLEHLRRKPLHDTVLDERPPDRLRQRTGHHPVERPLRLIGERAPTRVGDRSHRPQRKRPVARPIRAVRPRRRLGHCSSSAASTQPQASTIIIFAAVTPGVRGAPPRVDYMHARESLAAPT